MTEKLLVGIVTIIILVVGVVWSGLLPQKDFFPALNLKEESNTGIANPAAELCIEAGGELSNVTSEAGEEVNCVFPSGDSCEEWAFFRGECPVEGISNTAAYFDGKSTVSVIYRIFNNTAVLNATEINIGQIDMRIATSGSGARYLSEDGSIEFWEHQGEGTLSVDGGVRFVGKTEEQESFIPTETFRGTNADGQVVLFEQRDYMAYRLTVGGDVTTGALNTERGWNGDMDATVYVLNWQSPDEEQIIFVRKSDELTLTQLSVNRNELQPAMVLKSVQSQ